MCSAWVLHIFLARHKITFFYTLSSHRVTVGCFTGLFAIYFFKCKDYIHIELVPIDVVKYIVIYTRF